MARLASNQYSALEVRAASLGGSRRLGWRLPSSLILPPSLSLARSPSLVLPAEAGRLLRFGHLLLLISTLDHSIWSPVWTNKRLPGSWLILCQTLVTF